MDNKIKTPKKMLSLLFAFYKLNIKIFYYQYYLYFYKINN